jgi:ATP synthase protein I
MTSNAESGHLSGRGNVGVSGPTKSLWLRLLRLSLSAAGAGLLVSGALAFLLDGAGGAWSSSFGGALVILFFAISLLIGHFVGRNNPSGAVGMFVATYFIKVIGFAVVLFVVGAPEWLHARWFVIGAVVAVIAWQTAEIFGFSRARLQIFNDDDFVKGGQHD